MILCGKFSKFSVHEFALLHARHHNFEASEIVLLGTLRSRVQFLSPCGGGELGVDVFGFVGGLYLGGFFASLDVRQHKVRQCDTLNVHDLAANRRASALDKNSVLVEDVDDDHQFVQMLPVCDERDAAGFDKSSKL